MANQLAVGEFDFAVAWHVKYALRLSSAQIKKTESLLVNRTPFVRQYGILSSKWGVIYAKRGTK